MRKAIALSVLALVGLEACGGGVTPPDDSRSPTPPPPPVRSVIGQGSGSVNGHVLGVIPFTTSAAGTLDFTIDWTIPDNLLGIYVTRAGCSFEQFKASQCQLLISSEARSPKPRTLQLPSAAAGDYLLMVGNPGDADESISYQIGLTTSTAAGGGAGLTLATPKDPPRARERASYTQSGVW